MGLLALDVVAPDMSMTAEDAVVGVGEAAAPVRRRVDTEVTSGDDEELLTSAGI